MTLYFSNSKQNSKQMINKIIELLNTLVFKFMKRKTTLILSTILIQFDFRITKLVWATISISHGQEVTERKWEWLYHGFQDDLLKMETETAVQSECFVSTGKLARTWNFCIFSGEYEQ